jgi:hypothetical protein
LSRSREANTLVLIASPLDKRGKTVVYLLMI